MARPIEPTPILEGKDAVRLLEDVDRATYNGKKEKFLKECSDIYKKTQSK